MNPKSIERQITEFNKAIAQVEKDGPGKAVSPAVHQAYLDGLLSERDKLLAQLVDAEDE
jgi:hypothetical protein